MRLDSPQRVDHPIGIAVLEASGQRLLTALGVAEEGVAPAQEPLTAYGAWYVSEQSPADIAKSPDLADCFEQSPRPINLLHGVSLCYRRI